MEKIPLIINNFSDGKVISIKGNINNNEVYLYLDTGASRSIIDKRKLEKFTSKTPLKSLSLSGIQFDVETEEVDIKDLKIGSKSIEKRFYVVDLLNLNNSLTSNYIQVIDGIIGNDVLFELNSIIDLKEGVLIID